METALEGARSGVMPRFFFNLRNSIGFLKDDEGQELQDPEQARATAIHAVRSIISEESRTGLVDLRGRIEVVDEGNMLVLTLPFSDAIEVHIGPPADGAEPGLLA